MERWPKRSGRRGLVVATLCGVMVVAACGGGGGTKKAASPSGQEETTSTTAANPDAASTTSTSTVTGAAPVASGSGSATTTTARSAAAKTSSKTTATTATIHKQVSGGITNVTAAPSTAPSQNIQPGGTVTFLKTADIAGFDPLTIANSGSSDGPPAELVYDLLVYSDPKDGLVKPQTAESLTSSDAVVWTLKLRPNIKFSDGTPYDANAVKFNWQRLQDPNNHAVRAAAANLIQSMDATDAVTLRLTLKAKNGVFPQAVAQIPFIASPTALQAKGTGFASDPVGAGPFVLKSWTRDSQMLFVRSPSYWNPPRPYVDQVIIRPITEETQRMNAFSAGQGNLMYISTAANADQVQKGGGVPYTTILNGGLGVLFNVKKAPFNDLRARQAVAMSIDRSDYAKVVNGGFLEPPDSGFRHESPFFDPALVQIGYDPVKAQQLFDQLAQETGGPMQFTLGTFAATNYQTAAQYIQAALGKMKNVKVTIDVQASATAQVNINSSNFTAFFSGSSFDDPEPTWTTYFACDGKPNPTGFCDAKFDADGADQRATLDAAQRIADIKDMQKIFYTQIPLLWTERRYSWVFAVPALQDVQWVNDGLILLDRLWLKTR